MLPRATALGLTFALCLLACDSGGNEKSPPDGAAKTESPAPESATSKSPPAATGEAKQGSDASAAAQASCSGVLDTLIAKEPEVSVQLTVAGQIVPVAFVPGKVYPANPVWDAGAAPSLCAAVLTPPQVEQPAMNLVGQLEVAGAPALRVQATGVTIGDVDLAAPGSTMTTGFYLPKSDDPNAKPEALNFTAGKMELQRVEGVKSRIKLVFAGATGKLVPSDRAFTLDGSITATVGGR